MTAATTAGSAGVRYQRRGSMAKIWHRHRSGGVEMIISISSEIMAAAKQWRSAA